MKQQDENIAIKIEGLKKSYDRVVALTGVDLTVYRGEIFGFLGPNGAGKTTTIRCLLGQIRPDSGRLQVLGFDSQGEPVAVKVRSGYLPGELHLNANLTAAGQLRYFIDLRGKEVNWSYVRELAERLNLELERPIKNLSKGNKQKVGVIQALMHRPALLLLDEPSVGLDPLMQQEVLALIREANDAGATVFFSSHIMTEVEAIATRVGIIRRGAIVEVADTSALTDRTMRKATIRFREPVNCKELERLANVKILSQDDGRSASLQVWGEMDGLIKVLAAYPVIELETERPTLEEVFLEYYRSERESPEGK